MCFWNSKYLALGVLLEASPDFPLFGFEGTKATVEEDELSKEAVLFLSEAPLPDDNVLFLVSVDCLTRAFTFFGPEIRSRESPDNGDRFRGWSSAPFPTAFGSDCHLQT